MINKKIRLITDIESTDTIDLPKGTVGKIIAVDPDDETHFVASFNQLNIDVMLEELEVIDETTGLKEQKITK